jgi:dephospho-CoA kinase
VKKIGLTGGIGSGKSIICNILKIMGYPVFNSDDQAKLLMTTNNAVIQQIKNLFGEEAYIEDTLNRPYLASKVFYDEKLKLALNKIVHPAVRAAFDEWAILQKKPLVFNEAAILYETGAYKTFDYTVLVAAPEEIRIARVTSRDKTTIEEVEQRMKNQWKDEVKIEMASYVINNDDTTLVTPKVIAMLKYFESAI